MASSDDELSWPSSSELHELEIEVQAKDESRVWQNNWTSVNPPSRRSTVPSTSPPLSSTDDEDEQPSPLASQYRKDILSSAERIKATTKSRKRKAPVSSPTGARKKRAVGTTSDTPFQQTATPRRLAVPPKQTSQKKLSKSVPATPGNKKNTSLLPTPPSSLNIQSTSEVTLAKTSDLTTYLENMPLKHWDSPGGG
ncbi:hypothetical protein PV11_05470 [Exophiala sideris]|uniref:Uncharacterized protein n=1 Tax=Exophiala sideris TaxID=1016849 RepID=A0A0D1X6P3_9EURO|nr:hypothetical protein PV11_05470 [Exophiala sideris]